jgi:hypothetical protein
MHQEKDNTRKLFFTKSQVPKKLNNFLDETFFKLWIFLHPSRPISRRKNFAYKMNFLSFFVRKYKILMQRLKIKIQTYLFSIFLLGFQFISKSLHHKNPLGKI